MGDFGGHFRQLSVQVIMLGTALCLPTILHAQNRGLANAAAHNSQHAGGTPFVSGNLPTIAFTNANLGNSPQASAVFVPAGLNVSGHVEETPFANISAGSTAVSSPASNTFVFTGSPTSFSVVSVPNESTAVAIDFTGPLSDMMRFGLVADPKQSNAPGGLPGGTLNVTGANHYDAGIAPSLILGRYSRYPVTVTFSSHMELAEDPYWLGHEYGWISTGVGLRTPLSFIPKQFGKWSAGANADLCYYGTTADEFVHSIGLQMPKVGAAMTVNF